MSGKLLRSRLFGYKKSDVLEYIERLDERAAKRVDEADKRAREKEAEANALKAEMASVKGELEEAQKNRDAVVSVLEVAQKHASDIVENAKRTAYEIESSARENAEKEKNNLNREIEIKKRDINNHFLSENKKINALRREIEDMRKTSCALIKKFEHELGNIDETLKQKENMTENAMEKSRLDNNIFFNSVREVPIRVIKSQADEKEKESNA